MILVDMLKTAGVLEDAGFDCIYRERFVCLATESIHFKVITVRLSW